MPSQSPWTRRTIFYAICLAVVLLSFFFLPWFAIQVPVLGIAFSHSAAVWPFKVAELSSSIHQLMQNISSDAAVDSRLTNSFAHFQIYAWTWYAMLAFMIVALVFRFALNDEEKFVTWSLVALAVCTVSAIVMMIFRALLVSAVQEGVQEALNSTSLYSLGSGYSTTIENIVENMFKVGPGAWVMLVGSAAVLIFTIAARVSAKPGTALWALVKGEGGQARPPRAAAQQSPGGGRQVRSDSRPTVYRPGLMLIGTPGIQITRFPHTVGRDPSCDTVIDDPSAAPRLCAFRTAGARIVIEDLGSESGTRLDGEKLPPNRYFQLFDDDEIAIGSVVFRVKIFNAAAGDPQ